MKILFVLLILCHQSIFAFDDICKIWFEDSALEYNSYCEKDVRQLKLKYEDVLVIFDTFIEANICSSSLDFYCGEEKKIELKQNNNEWYMNFDDLIGLKKITLKQTKRGLSIKVDCPAIEESLCQI